MTTANQIPGNELNIYPKTIQDYLAQKPFFTPLIHTFPSLENLDSTLKQKTFSKEKRALLTSTLQKQYKESGLEFPSQPAGRQGTLQLLKFENTFTITTGHQLCLLSGPLYVMYKIASTIKLCQQVQAQNPDKNIIPVFWMATEDHDFQEVNHLHLFKKRYEWQTPQQGAVGRFLLQDLPPLLSEITDTFNLAPFAKELEKLINKAYAPGNTLAQATRIFIHALFADYDLLIMDGDEKVLKSSFVPLMQKELEEQVSKRELEKVNKRFEKAGYKAQINPRPTGLFYLHEKGRGRIDVTSTGFEIHGTNIEFSKTEIVKHLKEFPEKFSPNVSLRPIYQEFLLPNIATIGGPGETSYWLQLKPIFDSFGIDFPVLVLRDSFVLVNSSTQKKINKFNLQLSEVFKGEEELVKKILSTHKKTIDVRPYEQQMLAILQELKNEVVKQDGSLSGFMNAEMNRLEKQLTSIQKKITQSSKRQNDQVVSQVRGIKNSLFPNGVLQERYDSLVQYYLNSGTKLVNQVVQQSDPLALKINVLEL